MLFRQNSCRKSQKGVYLHRIKSQKGANMEVQKSRKGADDIIMKRKIYQQLLDWKEKRNGEVALLIEGARRIERMVSPIFRFTWHLYCKYKERKSRIGAISLMIFGYSLIVQYLPLKLANWVLGYSWQKCRAMNASLCRLPFRTIILKKSWKKRSVLYDMVSVDK